MNEMDERSIKNRLNNIISSIIEKIASEVWSKNQVSQLRSLIDELEKPCVVALAGEVSSGKSSLINAILGGDYAKTAITETTALLTYFRFGNPKKDRQVKIVYSDGKSTYGSLDLLKEGHGNNEELLDDTIDFVEAEVNSDILKDVIFVDTPGTGSTLDIHNDNLLKLISSNNQRSINTYKKADALLYLFNYFGKKTNEDTIADFEASIGIGKHSVNVLGIVNKIDIQKELLEDPLKFTSKIEKTFAGKLNHVTAVSSQMYISIKEISDRKLMEIKRKVDKLDIKDIDYITDQQSFFESEDEDEEEVFAEFFGLKYRRNLSKDFGENRKYNWIAFKRIICFIRSYDGPKNKLKRSLLEYTRFEKLMYNIKVNILDRSKLIVYYRVTNKLKELLSSEVFHLKKKRIKAEEELYQRKREFLQFLSAFKSPVARDLFDFVKHSSELIYPKSKSMTWITDVKNDIDSLIDIMDVLNIDVLAERVFKEKYNDLDEEQQQELKIIFGIKGETLSERLNILINRGVDFFERVSYWKMIKEKTKIGSKTRKLSSLAMDAYLKMIDFKNRINNGVIEN